MSEFLGWYLFFAVFLDEFYGIDRRAVTLPCGGGVEVRGCVCRRGDDGGEWRGRGEGFGWE